MMAQDGARVHQPATKPQFTLQMKTVLHGSAICLLHRTLLKTAPGTQYVGVVAVHTLPSLPILAICIPWLPLFCLKGLDFGFKARSRAEGAVSSPGSRTHKK